MFYISKALGNHQYINLRLLRYYLYRPKNEASSAISVTVFQLAINDDITGQETRGVFLNLACSRPPISNCMGQYTDMTHRAMLN